jgi:tellurite methyltransferase
LACEDDPASAHQAWDRAWTSLSRDPGKPSRWRVAELPVARLASSLADSGARHALDIGSGMGRHTVLMAQNGLRVTAVDASPRAVAETGRQLRELGLPGQVVLASFVSLPFLAQTFDYVLAWNVLYHGDGASVRLAAAEVGRVLRPGGLFQGTMLSARHRRYGQGTEVSPGAFVVKDARDDKAYPHYYCDARMLLSLHPRLEPVELADIDQAAGDPQRRGSRHWEFVFEKTKG